MPPPDLVDALSRICRRRLPPTPRPAKIHRTVPGSWALSVVLDGFPIDAGEFPRIRVVSSRGICMRHIPGLLVVPMALLGAVSAASAADIPITNLKLIMLDKPFAGAKTVFLTKGTNVTKGPGTDAQITATFEVAYNNVSGSF